MNHLISQYKTQQILAANPVQQAALLMEAGQLFISKAIKSVEDKEFFQMTNHLSRVVEIINEATLRLNREGGGELVANLDKIYDWWIGELLEVSGTRDIEKLQMVSKSMGEIGSAWFQLDLKRSVSNSHPQTSLLAEV